MGIGAPSRCDAVDRDGAALASARLPMAASCEPADGLAWEEGRMTPSIFIARILGPCARGRRALPALGRRSVSRHGWGVLAQLGAHLFLRGCHARDRPRHPQCASCLGARLARPHHRLRLASSARRHSAPAGHVLRCRRVGDSHDRASNAGRSRPQSWSSRSARSSPSWAIRMFGPTERAADPRLPRPRARARAPRDREAAAAQGERGAVRHSS